jgi:hypothetical protein
MGSGALALVALAVGSSAMAGPPTKCAKPDEVTAIQAASIQQELMVAALTCNEITNFNAFQTGYSQELRSSDGKLQRMFQRLFGGRRGENEYHAFKTRLANNSSIRSIHNNTDYCHDASMAFAAALGANKPTLADFVSGVPVSDPSPVNSCEIRVAVGLSGLKVAPNIVPKPNPLRVANLAEPSPDTAATAVAPPAPSSN